MSIKEYLREKFTNAKPDENPALTMHFEYTKAVFSLGTCLTMWMVAVFSLIERLIIHPEPFLTFPYDTAEFIMIPLLGIVMIWSYVKADKILDILFGDTIDANVRG
ncbi:MAG: hypothetical protein IKS74_00800 [Methanomicrobium sp.]|nr:hypothetical protein [Methanomicrobium sp.]